MLMSLLKKDAHNKRAVVIFHVKFGRRAGMLIRVWRVQGSFASKW